MIDNSEIIHRSVAGCAFCDIARGADNSTVYEDGISMGFLDHRPLFHGHVLLIPKDHYATLPDLDPLLISRFFQNVALLCRAVEAAMGAEGTFVAINNIVSQSVPHLHVHIVPRNKGDGLKGFFWPRTKYRDVEELIEVRDKIRKALESSGTISS